MESGSKRILFLTKLKVEDSRSTYDAFVRSHLLPLVNSFESVVAYEVFRIDGSLFDGGRNAMWDYVDVIDVKDVVAYESDVAAAMETELGKAFEVGWLELVDRWLPVYGTRIDEVD